MPFLGNAALAAGALTRYELRRHHVAVLPNVYLPARTRPNLLQRTVAA